MTFKVGDILATDEDYIRDSCTVSGGNPDCMLVRSLDFYGDPVFTWEDADVSVGYSSPNFRLVQAAAASSLDLRAAMTGKPLKFRSGCAVKFVAFVPEAKPHCQLVLLNPATGNVVLRYINGKGSEEPYDEPGDILLA
ncbi:hypothetical protein ACJBUE_20795 (plasmid) [Ralstonia syzygii subsp. celebesensis]|uniref:Uncharacterized protein n=1 Tax=blood disease bacterium R229 TaxID=741978 RepID=G2ZVX5_9RALS|nr:hypothetical protein [Ralstonia syzygii]CCA83256.1 conserved hypothetical protein [blood disease bacterium R229]